MPDDSLADAEAKLSKFSSAHRPFYVPITRAISLLGGRARKRDVTIKVRELLANTYNDKQLDYLETNNRFGWVRRERRRLTLCWDHADRIHQLASALARRGTRRQLPRPSAVSAALTVECRVCTTASARITSAQIRVMRRA